MRVLPFFIWGVAIACSSPELRAESPSEIYQRLVIPLIQSSNSSSCSECHLQGVRIDDFLTTDPKASFASLRARGWIDTKHPSESKLLQFIAKKPAKSTELMDQVRKAELEGISQWIHAAVEDPESLSTSLPPLNDLKLDDKLMRHVRNDQILTRFVDTIWSQLERCANCHSPDRNAKQVEKHGEQMSWIVPNAPAETLQLLEERKLINLQEPSASLLKTKALGKDKHGGGVKFPEDGHTDRQWDLFLSDYAAIKKDLYSNSTETPQFDPIRTWRTGLHLRIKELPSVPAGTFAIVTMHRIAADGTVSKEPTAFGEGRVSKDGLSWGTSMKLIEPTHLRGSGSIVDWNTLLPSTRYQLRWSPVQDPKVSLEQILALPFTGQTEINSLWNAGHSDAKTILFGDFKSTSYLK